MRVEEEQPVRGEVVAFGIDAHVRAGVGRSAGPLRSYGFADENVVRILHVFKDLGLIVEDPRRVHRRLEHLAAGEPVIAKASETHCVELTGGVEGLLQQSAKGHLVARAGAKSPRGTGVLHHIRQIPGQSIVVLFFGKLFRKRGHRSHAGTVDPAFLEAKIKARIYPYWF